MVYKTFSPLEALTRRGVVLNKDRISRGVGNVFLSVVLGILLAAVFFMVFGAVFVWFALSELDAANVDGPAPDGGYEVRRAWGEQNLREYFGAAEDWIRENQNIESDIGIVTGVAPIGGPNKYCNGFGECWATMNLQVIGEKGEGILSLSEVSFDGRTNSPYVEVSKTPWHYKPLAAPE